MVLVMFMSTQVKIIFQFKVQGKIMVFTGEDSGLDSDLSFNFQ
jgi:hypothetical protein